MADPMRIRAKAINGKTVVRVLMAHEMETGQRRDSSGDIIPAWYIQEISASLNKRQVFRAEWGPSISKNPYMQFTIKGGQAGDTVSIRWKDNRGQSRTDSIEVT